MQKLHILKNIEDLCKTSYLMLFYGLPIISASLIIMAVSITEDIEKGAVGIYLTYAPMLENILFSLFFLIAASLITDINIKRNGEKRIK